MAIADSMRSGLAGGVLVLRGGEGAGPDVLVALASGGLARLAKFGVLANKFRDVVGRQSEDVLNVEHLGVAARPGADADRGNRQRLRHPLAQGAWDAVQYDGELP